MESNTQNIKEILTENKIIGLVVQDIESGEMLIEAAGSLSDDYNKILYISVNTPYEALINKFKQNKINTDKFYFIDCITMTENGRSQNKNCTYVSSPAALDEIHSAISDVLNKQEIHLALLDSPFSLLIYHEHMDVLKFVHLLMIKLLAANCKGIFPFQKESAESLRKSIEMFTDKIVNLESGEVILYNYFILN